MKNQIVLSSCQPIINLLQKKLMQYLGRIYDPATSSRSAVNVFCKIGILQALMEKGFVEKEEIEKVLSSLSHGKMTQNDFEEAWDVIADYNSTGGHHAVQPARYYVSV